MTEIIRTILVMSVSGSIIALLLFAIKPLIKNRLPKSAQYYMWLIVVAALLVPVSRFISIPQYAEHVPPAPIHSIVEWNVISTVEQNERILEIQRENPIITDFSSQQSPVSGIVDVASAIYPIGVVAVFLYHLFAYAFFLRKTHRNSVRTDVDCKIPVYFNTKATTPMLVGLFSPKIILPEREYSDAQLQAVLLHELTHLRRKDVLVKWLSVLACAVHWFNPIVWLVRREIDRACELSCDEAVIAKLDASGRQTYGDTLIYVAADHKPSTALAMSESGRNLKERLGAIMKSKKRTRISVIISAVLLIGVAGAAVTLGTGSGVSDTLTPPNLNTIAPAVLSEESQQIMGIIDTTTNTETLMFDYSTDDSYKYMKIWVDVYEYGIPHELNGGGGSLTRENNGVTDFDGKLAVTLGTENEFSYRFTVINSASRASWGSVEYPDVSLGNDLGRASGAIDEPVEIADGKEIVLYRSISDNGNGVAIFDAQQYVDGGLDFSAYPVVVLVKCMFTSDETLVGVPNGNSVATAYTNNDYGFSIAFPDSWADKASIEYQNDEFGERFKISSPQMNVGTVARIYVYAKSIDWESNAKAKDEPYKYLGENSEYVFVRVLATDLPVAPNDEDASELFMLMQDDILAGNYTFTAFEPSESSNPHTPRTATNTQYEAFYNLIQWLYNYDSGLNNPLNYIAVDMTNVPESDREPLKELLGGFAESLDATLLLDTFDGLVASGYIAKISIDGSNNSNSRFYSFEEGVLFEFSDVYFGENELTAHAQKYRTSLGAVMVDFTVTFEDGEWIVQEPESIAMA